MRHQTQATEQIGSAPIVARPHTIVALATLLFASWCSALELQGPFTQGALLLGQAETGEVVRYRDRELQQDEQRRFIIGLDRDAGEEILLLGELDNVITEYRYTISPRIYKVQHIEGVAQKYVEPDPEQVTRTRREGRLVGQARKQQRQQNAFMSGFQWPATGPITGVFGSQRVYNGQPRRPHYGVDIARPVGTPVAAPAAGLVTLAEPDLFFSGGTIIIDHGMGLSSTFLHLHAVTVNVGDEVEQGDIVGEIGATGRVTGAHLDWRMNWTGDGRNNRIDPELLVPPMPESASTTLTQN